MHPLHEVLIEAANGQFVRRDGLAEVLAPMAGDLHAVVELTGHSFILTDCDSAQVSARGADGLGGASSPDLLRWLAGSDGWIGTHDVVLVARGQGGDTLSERDDLELHPRVVRSRKHRRNVRVYGDQTGLITIGHGLVGRLEVSVEVPGNSPPGSGRRLIAAGLEMVPPGELIWAQVAPGNAASLRAFLTSGFVPIAAETLLERG